MKQTAIDWLIEQLTPSISLQQKHIDDIKEKAKEMHKKEIIDAIDYAYFDEDGNQMTGEEYYNETYKSE